MQIITSQTVISNKWCNLREKGKDTEGDLAASSSEMVEVELQSDATEKKWLECCEIVVRNVDS